MPRPAEIINAIESSLGLPDGEGRPVWGRIVPVVLVADTTDPALSNSTIRRRAGGGATDAAVAAEFSAVLLLNPSSSGVDAAVERIIVSAQVAAQNCVVGIMTEADAVGSADSGLAGFTDTRIVGLPACQVHRRTAAAITVAPVMAIFLGGNQLAPVPLDMPMLVSPGFALAIAGNDVAEGIAGSFTWLEQTRSEL